MGIDLPCVCQETDSHCGPAVLEMLLQNLNTNTTQDEIVAAGRVKTQILHRGMRPDQLAAAIRRLYPNFQFWFKQYTTMDDLDVLIHDYQIPVAVNWQGLFYDSLEEEARDFPKENTKGDHGHYSVISDIFPERDEIVVTDTYSDYHLKPRVFSFSWFETRWWDKDYYWNKKTKLRYELKTERLSFIVVPKEMRLPDSLNLKLPADLPDFEVTTRPKRNRHSS